MGFRDDLPLSFIRDYEWALNNGAPQDLIGEEREPEPLRNPSSPFHVGNGPEEFSTTQEIVQRYPPAHCWDVNGWYALLGAHHRMGKVALRAAYMAADGPNEALATFAFKSLINEPLRRFYDLLPLGGRYMDDPWVQEEIKRQVMAAASKAGITPEQMLQELGLVMKDQDDLHEMLDDHDHLGDDLGTAETEWLYSYYLWNVDERDANTSLLEDWQLALVRACSERKIKTRLRVGLFKSDDYAYRITPVDDHLVVFINLYEFADPELAELAVKELTQTL